MAGRAFIQNPGPTNIPDEVLEAFRRPAVDFAAPSFVSLIEELWHDLPELFGGAADVVVYTAVGHGAWEAALVNLLEVGDSFLLPSGGVFGSAWAEMARELGYRPVTTEVDTRRPPDPAEVQALLEADLNHDLQAVFIAHTETSTGSLANLAAIRQAIDDAEHPALLVVDAVASFATDPVPMMELGIDVVVAASQKGMMMPPGLSFCALSQRAINRSEQLDTRRFYWSWPRRRDYSFIYHRFGGTPPEQHLFALRAAMDLIAAEGGMAAVARRHRRIAEAVHIAVGGWGSGGPWQVNVIDPAERAAAVTCVRSGDLDASALVEVARERFSVSLGEGMGDSRGRAFRIGHLGSLNEPMILGALGGIEAAMEHLGYPHGPGVSLAARHLGETGPRSRPQI